MFFFMVIIDSSGPMRKKVEQGKKQHKYSHAG